MFKQDLFNKLYNHYCAKVYAIALNVIKQDEASKDVTQLTFMKIYQNMNKFKDIEVEDAGPLIGAIARNTAIDVYRKTHNMQLHEELVAVEQVPGYSVNTLDALIEHYDLSGLRKYLQFLSDEERDLLILKYYYVFMVRDISKLLGISNAAATSRLYRLKGKIARLISEGVIQNEE